MNQMVKSYWCEFPDFYNCIIVIQIVSAFKKDMLKYEGVMGHLVCNLRIQMIQEDTHSFICKCV